MNKYQRSNVRWGVSCILVLTMLATSCGWITTAISILNAAAPALINILNIVALSEGKPVDAALSAKVNGDAANLKKVLQDYAAAQASAQPSVCPQVQAALNTYESDLPAILEVSQVSNQNTQQKIAVLSGLVVGVFAAIEPLIPGCQAPPAASVTKMAAERKMSTQPTDLNTFISSYNAALVTPTGNPALDKATPGMKLHKHSKAVRILTLGILK